ncbi:hypothetical protein L1987_18390 [Smallanthus sonchifolius]|uniref:Uncharacterized protein n=1 Tax=Smallanthus sonchifolius TaxID=185202 RepID=A0ACB9J1S4_9ASTR|nr:hypothetical protein L1987_18390 [Smallanthus sonchifolius]
MQDQPSIFVNIPPAFQPSVMAESHIPNLHFKAETFNYIPPHRVPCRKPEVQDQTMFYSSSSSSEFDAVSELYELRTANELVLIGLSENEEPASLALHKIVTWEGKDTNKAFIPGLLKTQCTTDSTELKALYDPVGTRVKEGEDDGDPEDERTLAVGLWPDGSTSGAAPLKWVIRVETDAHEAGIRPVHGLRRPSLPKLLLYKWWLWGELGYLQKLLPDSAPMQPESLQAVLQGYLQKLLPDSAPMQPESLQAVLQDVKTKILPGVTHWQSPDYFAYFSSNSSVAGFLGEMLSAGINMVGFSWITSPAATKLEMIVLDWLANLLKLPNDFLSKGPGGGAIQGTASEALLVVLLAARDKVLSEVGKDALGKLVVYGSDQTHSSLQKACQIAGIHPENLRLLRTETCNEYALSPESLTNAISHDVASGLIPLLLCATVGTTSSTTSSTAVDPLLALGKITKFHVDAAYAGSACICPEYRHHLNGIEEADKWFLTNFDCSALWIKDRSPVIQSLSTNPEYLKNKASQGSTVIDYKDWQIPLGRRFRYETFFSLHVKGKKISEIVDGVTALWGRKSSVLSGKYVLRFVVGAPLTEERHIIAAWILFQEAASSLLENSYTKFPWEKQIIIYLVLYLAIDWKLHELIQGRNFVLDFLRKDVKGSMATASRVSTIGTRFPPAKDWRWTFHHSKDNKKEAFSVVHGVGKGYTVHANPWIKERAVAKEDRGEMPHEIIKPVQNSASFAAIVKRKHVKEDTETESGVPVVVLNEDDCQGFFEVEIKYMGGEWIWMGFESGEVALKFKENEELNVFFKVIRKVDEEFVFDEKIVWMELSGLRLCAWTDKSLSKIVGERGEVLFVDDVKDEAMPIGRLYVFEQRPGCIRWRRESGTGDGSLPDRNQYIDSLVDSEDEEEDLDVIQKEHVMHGEPFDFFLSRN